MALQSRPLRAVRVPAVPANRAPLTARAAAGRPSLAPTRPPTTAPRVSGRPALPPHPLPHALPSASLIAGDAGDAGIVASEARPLRRLAWASFWTQLAASLVAAVVLWFCVAVERGAATPPPAVATWATAAGTAAALVSTFVAFGLTRAVRGVILRGDAIRRSAVAAGALAATRINLIGTGLSLIGLQATIGGLVARTLVSATANPVAASSVAARSAAPAALDVFALQASANALLAHFVSIVFATWVVRMLRAAAAAEAVATG